MNNARDEYLVFNEYRCIRAFTSDGVKAAMEDLGACAVVKRITEGELARTVTKNFVEPVPDEYEDDEISERRYRASRAAAHSFGRRSL